MDKNCLWGYGEAMTLRKQNFKPGNLICLSKAGRDYHGFKDCHHPARLMLLVRYDSCSATWSSIRDDQLSVGWYLNADYWEALS